MIYGQKETDKECAQRQFRVVAKAWYRELRDGRNPANRFSAEGKYLGNGKYTGKATLSGLGRDEFGLNQREVAKCRHLAVFNGVTSDVLAEILKTKRKAA